MSPTQQPGSPADPSAAGADIPAPLRRGATAESSIVPSLAGAPAVLAAATNRSPPGDRPFHRAEVSIPSPVPHPYTREMPTPEQSDSQPHRNNAATRPSVTIHVIP